MKLCSSDNHYTTGPQRPVYTASELEDFMEAFDDGVNFLQPKLSLKLKKQFQVFGRRRIIQAVSKPSNSIQRHTLRGRPGPGPGLSPSEKADPAPLEKADPIPKFTV